MCEYIGLDVSLKETAVSVRKGGKHIWRGKCPSDPKLLAELIRKRAPEARSSCSRPALYQYGSTMA